MSYYTKSRHKECIVEMKEHYGDYAVYNFCRCNAYKYIYRAGLKKNNPAIDDWNKAKWYIDYANELKRKHRFNPFYRYVSVNDKHLRGLFHDSNIIHK